MVTATEPSGGEIALPEFDTHVLKRVLKLESEANDRAPLTDEEIEADVVEYLEFLREHKVAPGREVLPSVRVDRVWHIHILQTADYARVCQEYLGFFLHHASLICGAGQATVYPWHYRGERDAAGMYAH